ncbi:MAG TPA: choice-of-anchor tandem repeat GloVer-containing protein [Rhizomicrobium sp.]
MSARFTRSIASCLVLTSMAFALPSAALAKAKLTVLHSFAGGADGASPYSTLIMDKKGDLYGTTLAGGSANLGTVFKISKKGVETIIHSFIGGNDGASPYAGVVMDAGGNLYGTTYFGGSSGLGVVYKIAANGAEAILHTFQGIYNNSDGSYPYGGVSFGTDGNLYGTTVNGGSPYDNGTIYAIAPNGAYSVLYALGAASTDGAHPYSDLVEFTFGDGTFLSGTASAGGDGFGVMFSLEFGGDFVPFLVFEGSAEDDGATPIAGVAVVDGDDAVGTTTVGGTYGLGTLFHHGSTSKEQDVEWSFKGIYNASDGSYPYAKPVFASDGLLYGTTVNGGKSSDSGTIYTYLESQINAEAVIYRFNGPDGSHPYGAVLEGKPGTFYGTASAGGAHSLGVVYKLVVK